MSDGRADKQDIAELLIRYSTGIDTRDWHLFRSCFADNVLAEYEGIATWDSADAITESMKAIHAEMGRTMHQLSNLAIIVDGDGATARAYVDAVLMAADGQSGLNARGVYEDRLVRTGAGWRIAHRRYTMVHFGTI